MPHYDPDTLGLLALGERGVTDDDDAHLAGCPACRREVDELAHVVAVARSGSVQDRPQAPPESVWQRITSELAAEPPSVEPPSVQPPSVDQPPATVSRLPRRRQHTALLMAAAALVGIVVGVGATYAATHQQSPTATATTQVALHPLDAPVAHGTAVLATRPGDQHTLTVQVQGLPSVPGTFYEVWLMNASPQRLLSLGVLDSTHTGIFQIPPGLDLSRYPVVDISLQPFNGSPAHSGNSAVRGTLTA